METCGTQTHAARTRTLAHEQVHTFVTHITSYEVYKYIYFGSSELAMYSILMDE